jgi:integral membrane protein
VATAVRRLRRVALAEGFSFLILLGVAMPLKYLAAMPWAVRIVGWAHGILFVGFCAALGLAMRERRWPLRRSAVIFVAGLVPFGPFLVDRRLKDEEA